MTEQNRSRLEITGLADAVYGRTSVRKYTDEPVPREDVEAMVGLAVRAANAGNAQGWRFVAVEDAATRAAMKAAVDAAIDEMAAWPEAEGRGKDLKAYRAYATFFDEAPLVMAVFGLPYRSLAECCSYKHGLPYEERDRLRQRPDIQSIGAAVQLLCTAAHAMGYGSCWMTAPVLAAPAIEELLGVEPPAQLVAVVPIGRPATASRPVEPPPALRRPRVPLTMSASRSVAGVCADILAGAVPAQSDLEALLEAGDEAPLVFSAAREMRSRHTGDAVFLYGFVYFSTYCRNACAFCFYRAGNDACPRYRKTSDEVVEICRDLAASGVVLLDLTMGEDPLIHDDPATLSELVAAVVEATGTPVMVSPGVLPEPVLRDLRAGRRRLVRAVPGDPHARALRAPARGAAVRGARGGARARPGAPACSSRTGCSPASATRRPTAPPPSSPCVRRAGSRCAS